MSASNKYHTLHVHAIVAAAGGPPDTTAVLSYRNFPLIHAVEATSMRDSWVECIHVIWYAITG